MQINNNINFTGIYKIPLNDKNLKEIKQYVLPMYKYLRQEEVLGFPGENPMKMFINERINLLADIAGGSKEWLMMNAEHHNVNTDFLEDKFMHIITTKNDILSLKNFFLEKTKKRIILKQKIKNLFKKPEKPNINKSLPLHLQLLEEIINITQKENSHFTQFSGDRIVKVNDTKELLTKMLME